ncbi:cold shock domain-containing protein [Streptomyces xylophagus]|uniref:cold shock domain-containing protein n=1 Tax=Streptomyces xylophagus TaxID=285514 RepID=UPI00131BED56|nr:cold shock domain-containing protein [Streptomyces xylophagus]
MRPDMARSDLALMLNTLSHRLAEAGRPEDALSQVEEATQIHRELAQIRPELFLPNLAMTLNNLADRLADLGRHEAGRAALEEATQVYEHLARDRPGMFLADLAMTLNSLSDRLAALGRHEEALAVVSRAAEFQRALTGRGARQRLAATAASVEAADTDYVAGTLQWFNSEKGYGFLAVDNGPDRFVHYSAIDTDDYRSLETGQRVAVRVAAVSAEASGSASVLRQESASVSIDDDFRESVESLRTLQSAVGSRLSGRFGYAARRWSGSAAQANRPAEHGSATRHVLVAVVIDGQPGELARLFADAGRAGVNIEDIRIETPSGQQEGLAQLLVETSAAAGLAAALAERGWSIST